MTCMWWEKTIEYKFLALLFLEEGRVIAPLDGNHEMLGDAVFSDSENRWVLIEFKRDAGTIASELAKFDKYESARQALGKDDSHHWLIYGYLEGTKLQLRYKTYFATRPFGSLQHVMNSGIDVEAFKKYITSFTSYKKGSGEEGGVGAEKYALVAGINKNGDVVQLLTLSDCQKQLNLEVLKEQTKALTRSKGFGR
jgi:hypothetical protein